MDIYLFINNCVYKHMFAHMAILATLINSLMASSERVRRSMIRKYVFDRLFRCICRAFNPNIRNALPYRTIENALKYDREMQIQRAKI